MNKLIVRNRERSWFLVKEFVTKVGLKARICQCVWSDEIKKFGTSLHDHYTGYVQIPEEDTHRYYDDSEIDVHGGVTYQNVIDGEDGEWAGFDLGHLGDEYISNPIEYAEAECEKLAEQIKNHGT
jgi:hypothetical protein